MRPFLAVCVLAGAARAGLVVDGVRWPPLAESADTAGVAVTNHAADSADRLAYPVFRLELGEHWTDFEIKASTNNYDKSGARGSELVYYYRSWTNARDEAFGDPDALTYYTDDYNADPRVWIRKDADKSVSESLLNTGSVVTAVYFSPSRDRGLGWMRRDNTNLVWSWMRVSDGGYEKNFGKTKTRWRPIRPDSWEAGRTVP